MQLPTLRSHSQISPILIESGSSFPSEAIVGKLFFRVDKSSLFVFDGSNWVGALQDIFRVLPKTTVFDATSLGKRIVLTSSVTIPGSTYLPGDAFSFYNSTSADISIVQGAALTLRLDGTSSTGTRLLAPYGTCMVWFNTTGEAIVSGSVS